LRHVLRTWVHNQKKCCPEAGEIPAAPDVAVQQVPEIDIKKFNFGDYLKKQIGPPPDGMYDPHAHHILFKLGNGEAQKKLVALGQSILKQYGLDPILGLENLVWAPNSVKGQHGPLHLKALVDALEGAHETVGSKKAIIEILKEHGEAAAKRK
jgi:A nuclease family of the HNH/ENDO VII superfamily with conserved AHH